MALGGPDEVAVLDRHHGRPVGWRQAVVGDHSDIWFSARIDDDAAAERLRHGVVGVSLEMEGRGVLPRPDEPGVVLPIFLPSSGYRGRPGPGWTLTAVALVPDGEPIARPGSFMAGVQ